MVYISGYNLDYNVTLEQFEEIAKEFKKDVAKCYKEEFDRLSTIKETLDKCNLGEIYIRYNIEQEKKKFDKFHSTYRNLGLVFNNVEE